MILNELKSHPLGFGGSATVRAGAGSSGFRQSGQRLPASSQDSS